MANMSGIFERLGAEGHQLPMLWLAAPLTGLLVQPVIGYLSDRTWCFLGRRRPYFLIGAILSSLSLIAMPNSSTLWMAAGLLWVLDASINVTMEPFRAFVGDLLPEDMQNKGFSMQSLFIGLGSVIASSVPWLFSNAFGFHETVTPGVIPESIKYAFYLGAGVFLFCVVWTVVSTKESPPNPFTLQSQQRASFSGAFHDLAKACREMPKKMRHVATVQFFTYMGLFCFFMYFAPGVARQVFHATSNNDPIYSEGIKWAGLCMSVYNGVCFLFSLVMSRFADNFGQARTHSFCLALGGLSLASLIFVTDKYMVFLPMVGLGVAWASILAMPYAMIAKILPTHNRGMYMGMFNFFIVLPQITASLTLGWIVTNLLDENRMAVVSLGGIFILIGAAYTLWNPVISQNTEEEEALLATSPSQS